MTGLHRIDHALWDAGLGLVAGVDEVGRGPLAGPVVAAAVILRPYVEIHGLNDSKKVSARARAGLLNAIIDSCIAIGIGCAWQDEIDAQDIRTCSLAAMTRAVYALNPVPDFVIVDGRDMPCIPVKGCSITRADGRAACVAAASIIAKLVRDDLMVRMHESYPSYGFDKHKGYPTAEHIRALREHGPCPLHRLSFRKVMA